MALDAHDLPDARTPSGVSTTRCARASLVHPALAAVTIATAPPFAFADVRPLIIDGVAEGDTDPVFVVGIDRSYFDDDRYCQSFEVEDWTQATSR